MKELRNSYYGTNFCDHACTLHHNQCQIKGGRVNDQHLRPGKNCMVRYPAAPALLAGSAALIN